MSKVFFTDPMIFRGPINPDPTDPVIGGGSAHGGQDPITNAAPCDFNYWQDNYSADLAEPIGTIDFDDYTEWWRQHLDSDGFNKAAWERFNSSVPWPFGN